MKHLLFVSTLILIPFSALSMDTAPTYIIPEKLAFHKKEVKKLCADVCDMLAEFQSSPSDETNTRTLIKIIEQIDCLKNTKITEQDLGFFAINQKPSFSDRFSFDTSKLFLASVFFQRLSQYNQNLSSRGHISPNKTQWKQYLKNKKLTDTSATSATFGITIPAKTIQEKTIAMPGSVAFDDLDILIKDIATMAKQKEKTIKRTAKLVYHTELTNMLTSSVVHNNKTQ